MSELDDRLFNARTIGAILKASRESLELSQRDIADQLNYRNINFISMIESGRSNIPLGKIVDIANVYQLSNKMAMCIVKELHSDAWRLFSALIQGNKTLVRKSKEDIDDELFQEFVSTLKKLNLDKMAEMVEASR